MISRTSFSLGLSVLALVLALIALSVQAQDITPKPAPTKRAWITEFTTTRVEAAANIATLPALKKQPAVDLSDGTPKFFLPLEAATRYVRIMCEVQCAISSTGKATIDDIVLPLLHPEYFMVSGTQTISVILAP
jgi:hypothetical protein